MRQHIAGTNIIMNVKITKPKSEGHKHFFFGLYVNIFSFPIGRGSSGFPGALFDFSRFFYIFSLVFLFIVA